MTMTEMAISARFRVSGGDAGEMERHLDAVMAELVARSESDAEVGDPAISLDLIEHSVVLELTARGVDYDDALVHALSSLRSAVHAAGAARPGREPLIAANPTKASVDLVSPQHGTRSPAPRSVFRLNLESRFSYPTGPGV